MTNNQLTEEELQTLIIELQQTAYRLNGNNSAYLMSDAIKPLRELQERRKAAMDSEPVIVVGDDGGDALSYRRLIQSFEPGTKLYLHAQPAPEREQLAIENFRSAIEGIGHIRRTLEETFGGLHGTHVEPDVLAECKAICDAIYAAYGHAQPAPVVPDALEKAQQENTDGVAGMAESYETTISMLRSRIAELESRTVKLPDDAEHDIMAPVAAYLSEKFKWDGSAARWDGRNEYDVLADRVKYALRMVIRRAAGIKVEAE